MFHISSAKESSLTTPSISFSNAASPPCIILPSPETVISSLVNFIYSGFSSGISVSGSNTIPFLVITLKLVSTNKESEISISKVISCLAFNLILANTLLPFKVFPFPLFEKAANIRCCGFPTPASIE